MNRKRILAIAKLVLLFGTPLALIFGLFSCGVYCGVQNRAGITHFERDWLGLDVEVPDDATVAKAPETKAPETKAPETRAPETKAPETKAPPTTAVPPSTPSTTPSVTPPATQVPSTTPPTTGGPEPLPPPQTKVDPLDGSLAARLQLPVTVRIKVLVDPPLIEDHPDWIDYLQRTVSRASQVYEQQFGIRLELSGVGRWMVATEGMGASELLDDLRGRPREGAEILVGFTNRPFDDTTAGQADTPLPDSPFNGAYGVVYATRHHREAHLRTLLHEVAHMFGALDITDPANPAYQAGSWMSYAAVPESREPWIDVDNRQRVLMRKDLPFAPEALPTPSPAEIEP
ncbi:M12 family metallo-peptidase [Paraliomyxa miuraensis]|uniref:M12 family metallo-peptidase n=1 Tax=Paraliomyxa miuraensis TaxID=376150 RepID=UPI00224CAB97|nr:M12 family metallo-peptidase [Paraliomyxa miuraensis]MCX4244801.1 M12 family metallo-peptidase [Paraliomyxa miuraensis]